jgi:hypothetical protein
MKDSRTRNTTTPRLFVVGLLVLAAACHHAQPAPAPTPAAPPSRPTTAAPVSVASAATLLQAMHDRYASTWYKTLTFTQKTTLGLPSGGEVIQTWYEAASLPGRLRIDTDLRSKGGTLFARDSIFSFNGGKLVGADSGVNELLVLGFDVYAQSVARSQAELRRLGFDLTKFHESSWQGVPVYVVGAVRGDTLSKQFWIERDRLLFVRMIEKTAQGHADTRFAEYAQFGGGWVAAQVAQIVNGKRRILEQYSDIHANVTFADGLFDPKVWSTAQHWMTRP